METTINFALAVLTAAATFFVIHALISTNAEVTERFLRVCEKVDVLKLGMALFAIIAGLDYFSFERAANLAFVYSMIIGLLVLASVWKVSRVEQMVD